MKTVRVMVDVQVPDDWDHLAVQDTMSEVLEEGIVHICDMKDGVEILDVKEVLL